MSQILVERHDGVAVVTLNRPEKRNALSPEMVVRLAQFWHEVAQDHAIRVVVVTGAGGIGFSNAIGGPKKGPEKAPGRARCGPKYASLAVCRLAAAGLEGL